MAAIKTLSDTLKRLIRVRTSLLLNSPFFGVLALNLRLLEDPQCQTAYTNGTVMGFNPAYIATLNDDQLSGLIAHEVMHCACGHPWRRDARDPKKWNAAADYAINDLLIGSGFTLPDGGLHDPQFAGKYSEWIYDRLPDTPNNAQGQGQGSGNGQDQGTSCGDVRDAPSGADAGAGSDPSSTPAVSETDWQQAQRQAIAAAQGTLPAGLRERLQASQAPAVDWRSLLRKYITEVTRADYTWTKPNRRYLAQGLFLPSLESHQCGPIVCAIDTSGSIDAVLLGQFASEIQAIVDDVRPTHVDIVYCDAQVHRVDRFEAGEPLTFDSVGGGGTSFAPVFAHVDQSDDCPAVVVYLTDMYGTFPTEAPDYPVIWASYSPVTEAPFGDVVPCR